MRSLTDKIELSPHSKLVFSIDRLTFHTMRNFLDINMFDSISSIVRSSAADELS